MHAPGLVGYIPNAYLTQCYVTTKCVVTSCNFKADFLQNPKKSKNTMVLDFFEIRVQCDFRQRNCKTIVFL